MSIHNNTTLEAINLQLGQNGFDAIEKIPGGEFHTGKWCAIFNPDDEELTVAAKDKNSTLLFPVGFKLCPRGTIYGEFNHIRHTATGKHLIAYRVPKLN